MPEELQALVRGHGRVPLIKRTLAVGPATVEAMQKGAGGNLGAAGLLWNARGQILLVRHDPASEWWDQWVTPGGAAKTGETPEETFLREVREEVLLESRIVDLTCVFELTVTDGKATATGFFFQFEAVTTKGSPSPGPGILEVRWFDTLPQDMAFRKDYLKAYERTKRHFIKTDSLGRQSPG